MSSRLLPLVLLLALLVMIQVACIRIIKKGEICRPSSVTRHNWVKCGDGLYCNKRTKRCQAKKRYVCSDFILSGPKIWNRCGEGFFCNRQARECQPLSN